MVGPGRGSSAGSIVAYLLGITAVDPIKYQLLFERFLNPERQTMPDIDIDFSDERRDEVIEYVRGKYGAAHVAQIITFGTFAARSIIRELIKTLEVSPEDARYILKELPIQQGNTITQMVQATPELSDYIKQSPKLRLLFSIAIRLEGIPRHISTHAAGVVISESPLIEHVPLTTGNGETALTQYAMNDLEAVGLLKMDFLGLKNLSLLERVTKSIRSTVDRHFSLENIPVNDEKTFAMLREGRANGVFQLESQGMQRVLKELKPTSFEDIVAVNALYRPGPMDFIPNYIDRKHGKEALQYPHPDLRPILEKTFGVLVYQEQIMQIAKEIAGYSLGKADILRRAVSKKNQQVMAEEKDAFIQGCLDNGYDKKVAAEIFSWVVRFSNYGFPRSHAVAYSMISYQLSYLKAHYPANFFAEILSAARNQQDKINLYIKEMTESNMTLLPPSINQSYGKYTVEGQHVRMGLHSIKGIGRDTLFEIIHARKDGLYRNLFDFCLRVSNKVVKRGTIESLILAGAFDSLQPNRASLLASIDQAMEQGDLFKEFSDQSSLFHNQIELEENYVDIEDFTIMKKLQDEKELLGMYISSHPLKNYRELLRRNGYISISDTELLIGKKNINGAVIIQEIKQIRTKRGEQMAFLTLADENMTMDAVLFPDLYREVKRWLEADMLVFVNGKIEKRNNKMQWVIAALKPFAEEELRQNPERTIFIKSTSETNATALRSILSVASQYPGDIPIILYDEEKKQSYKLASDYFLHPSGEALQQLYRFFGKENVVMQKRK
jgi:DNA polymerase-3 subunit alpha